MSSAGANTVEQLKAVADDLYLKGDYEAAYGLTRLTTLRNLTATLLASPAQVNLRHHQSTSIPSTHSQPHSQLNPRTPTGSLVRKKTLAACNIASLALSLPMRFL